MAALTINRLNRSLTAHLPRSQTIAQAPRLEIIDPVEESRATHYLFKALRADEVRILTVHAAASDNEQIRCRLEVYTRASAEKKYIAISYTWGSDQLTGRVVCDGVRLPVTANCEAALRALRRVVPNASGLDQRNDRRVWIDGVCIAQHDTDERTQQVARMGETFAQAEGCVVFIGESDEQTKTLEEMLDRYDKYQDLEPWFEARGIKKLRRNSYRDRALLAVKSVTERPWFGRAWVVQEVLLAAGLTIQLGGRNFRWRTFVDVLALCASNTMPARSLTWPSVGASGPTQLEHAVVQLYQQYRPAVPVNAREVESAPFAALDHSDLLAILKSTSGLKCRDPQDKLYALLPLFKQPLPNKIQPDYRKKVANVFVDLTETLLDHDLEEVLALAQYTHLSIEMPSWAVWWASLPVSPTLTHRRRLSAGMQGRLDSRDVPLSRKPHFFVIEKKLQIRGVLVDSICKLDSTTSHAEVSPNSRTVRRTSTHTQQQWERALMSTITSTSSGVELDTALKICPLGQWRTFTTLDGFRAVAASKVADRVYGPQVGDWIAKFLGCRGFFILRKHDLTGEYKLVGECMFVNRDQCPQPSTPTFRSCVEVNMHDNTDSAVLYSAPPIAPLKDFVLT
ncbi:hypothetical protein LTR97_011059 [Elasticomyces elasticus]|uniref:Heterokaryon incompatibility domain-containing protein n=1 Tax=Elasticomyces elasticus TaxID=574655 RepID=A0AAN7ZYQ7_9PEZI|nr:hypothetical protein LTR97_011059 [Elasticomyces elasticus]